MKPDVAEETFDAIMHRYYQPFKLAGVRGRWWQTSKIAVVETSYGSIIDTTKAKDLLQCGLCQLSKWELIKLARVVKKTGQPIAFVKLCNSETDQHIQMGWDHGALFGTRRKDAPEKVICVITAKGEVLLVERDPPPNSSFRRISKAEVISAIYDK